ncbi:hypothetical protein NGM37_26605 [Streptomyces sp. TRM76130]|nr:hypothetical protein [Streptomyces sp. TRM76130]
MSTGLSRRRLSGAGTAVVAAALTDFGGAGSSLAADGSGWREKSSAIGWPVLSEAPESAVEGSGQKGRLADGDAAVVLLYAARRLH